MSRIAIILTSNSYLFSVYSTAPAPVLTITGNPRNASFFQGLDLTLTCSITLAEAVDTSVTAQGTWTRNGSEMISVEEDGRITISNNVVETPPYQITLRLNPINISDAGTYKCAVTVTPQNATFIVGSMASISRTISVFGRMYTNLCLTF